MNSEPDIATDQTEVLESSSNPVLEAMRELVPKVDNSENEDSILDKLLGIDEPEPRRDSLTPESSAPQQDRDPDLDRALKALQRDGVPASVIDGMKSDPSGLKEWGLKSAKRQADVDAFGAKNAKAKATQEDVPSTPKSSSTTEDREADDDPLSEFGEIFGDEAAKPIRNFADKLRAEFEEKSRALEVKYETRSSYDQIRSEYGKDAPSFDDITDVAARVGRENPGKFDNIQEIVREAFRLRAGEPKKADPRNQARPTVGRSPARPVREFDREDAILNVLLSGGSKADALKAATR